MSPGGNINLSMLMCSKQQFQCMAISVLSCNFFLTFSGIVNIQLRKMR